MTSDPLERPRPATPREYTRGARARWFGLLAGLGGAALLFPFDGRASAAARALGGRLGGDLLRELEAVQQFGGALSLVIAGACVWALDRARRRRLLDLLAAAVLTGVAVLAVKMLVGRPRPRFEDPGVLLGPLGAYPLPKADPPGVYHAWDLAAPISSDLWSVPSSHTSGAVALGVFLVLLYPALRPMVVALVVVVGASRVLLGAHYPSDVLVGAGVAFFVSHAAVSGWWGVRALDWVWVRVVDRRAEPAFGRMYGASGVGPEGEGGGAGG